MSGSNAGWFGMQVAAAGSQAALIPASTIAAYAANLAVPIVQIDPDTAWEMRVSGFLDDEAFTLFNKMYGRDYKPIGEPYNKYSYNADGQLDLNPVYVFTAQYAWTKYYQQQLPTPSDDVIFDLQNSGLVTDDLANKWLVQRYGNNQKLADTIGLLRYEIPGPSDLVRFAVRDCFTPGIVQQYNYAAETPLVIQPWMKAQGYGSDTGLVRPPNATDADGNPINGNATWFDLYWWSHWELPSLTQGYDMVHRLYSDSLYGPSPDATPATYFDPADLETLQKTQDLPQYWRQRLQAISYHPLTRTDAESLYTLGLVEEDGLYHALRADGYSDANANLLVKETILRKQRNLGIDPGKVTKEWICTNYKTGIIADDKAKQLLMDNGFDLPTSEMFLLNCQLEIKAESAREKIKHLRVAYMMGVFNTPNLTIQFQQMQLNPFVYQDLVDRWKTQRDVKVKFASSRQLLTFFINGAISEPDITERLYNLGYEAASITTMIYNAKIQITRQFAKAYAQQAKLIAAQAKAVAQQALKDAKAQAAAQKQAQTIAEKVNAKRIKSIIRGATDSAMKKWYTDGIITLWEVLYKLYYKDYSISDAQRYVYELDPRPTEKTYVAAQKKAQSQYLAEGNPPLVQ